MFNFLFGISVCMNIVFMIIFILIIRFINKNDVFSLLFNREKKANFKDLIVNNKEYQDFYKTRNWDLEKFLGEKNV